MEQYCSPNNKDADNVLFASRHVFIPVLSAIDITQEFVEAAAGGSYNDEKYQDYGFVATYLSDLGYGNGPLYDMNIFDPLPVGHIRPSPFTCLVVNDLGSQKHTELSPKAAKAFGALVQDRWLIQSTGQWWAANPSAFAAVISAIGTTSIPAAGVSDQRKAFASSQVTAVPAKPVKVTQGACGELIPIPPVTLRPEVVAAIKQSWLQSHTPSFALPPTFSIDELNAQARWRPALSEVRAQLLTK